MSQGASLWESVLFFFFCIVLASRRTNRRSTGWVKCQGRDEDDRATRYFSSSQILHWPHKYRGGSRTVPACLFSTAALFQSRSPPLHLSTLQINHHLPYSTTALRFNLVSITVQIMYIDLNVFCIFFTSKYTCTIFVDLSCILATCSPLILFGFCFNLSRDHRQTRVYLTV